jgi:hypothetical protein
LASFERVEMSTSNFFVRSLADLVVGVAAVGGFIAASKNGETAGYWLIAVACGLLMSAIMTGYFEPSAKRVWCHALLIMWPELLALPVALMTCKGHGCAGLVAFLFLASLFTLILMAASFGAFFIRRRRT